MLLRKALEGFKIDRQALGYSPNTVRIYLDCLSVLADYLGEVEISEINKDDLIRFLHYLRTEYKPKRFSGSEKPLSPATIDNYWIAMRSFFKWAEETLEIENISDGIPRPKFAPPEIIPLTKEEILEAIKAATKKYVPPQGDKRGYTASLPNAQRNKAIILLLLDTGMRLGELTRLKRKDFDLETGTVTVRPFRSSRKSRPRHIPLGKVTRREVWKYIADIDDLRPDDPVFEISKSGIQSMLYRVKKRTGNDKIHAHRFRHTFAIQYLKNGGDIYTLQYFLGHSTLTMVKRYLYFADDDRRDAHRRASPADRWLERKTK